MSGPFFLFEFATARPIGYVELLDGAVYLQDLDQVETYKVTAKNLQDVAMDPGDSVALIKSLSNA